MVQAPLSFHPQQERVPQPANKPMVADEGVSITLRQHYANRKAMIEEAAHANRRRGYGIHTGNSVGFNEAFNRYGNATFDVIAGAQQNVENLQEKMDELFLVDELITAGFAVEAVKRASIENRKEVEKKFVGPANKNKRDREYRKIDRLTRELTL